MKAAPIREPKNRAEAFVYETGQRHLLKVVPLIAVKQIKAVHSILKLVKLI